MSARLTRVAAALGAVVATAAPAAAGRRRDDVDPECAGRDAVRARRGLRGPALTECARDPREPHARQDARRRHGPRAGRHISLPGRARPARAVPHDRSRRVVETGARSDRAGAPYEARGIARRRYALDARRTAATRRGGRRARARGPRRLVRVPRLVRQAGARAAGDGVTRAVRRRRRRAAGERLWLRRREVPHRPPGANGYLRLPGPVRLGAARSIARARLCGSVPEERARL